MSFIDSFKNILKRVVGEVPTTVLVERGLKVGANFSRQQGCYIDPTHCFLIQIGNNVTFSIRVTLLAHDASTKGITGYTKIGKIKIGNNVFIGANTTILPNVVIGNDVIIGANSVITKDIPDGVVVAGNPSTIISGIDNYKDKNLAKMKKQKKLFGKEYHFSKQLNKNKKKELIEAVKDGIAYID